MEKRKRREKEHLLVRREKGSRVFGRRMQQKKGGTRGRKIFSHNQKKGTCKKEEDALHLA